MKSVPRSIMDSVRHNRKRARSGPAALLALGLAFAGSALGCGSTTSAGGSGGAPATGGRSGSGGGNGSTGGAVGSGGAGTGGVVTGSGGIAAVGGSGPSSGGTSGTGGTGGGGSGSGGTIGSGTGGATPAGTCPANATFCSGFEDVGLPAGAVYRVNAAPGDWTRDYALDATVHNLGRSSLRVKSATEAGTSGSAYKLLSVPAPMGIFWVRFYIRSEIDLGNVDHNVFAEASDSDDPNAPVAVEFAEDVGISFNTRDDVRWPVGYGRTSTGGTNPLTLPKETWHCIEIAYDSQTRRQQLFIGGAPRIDATNYPTQVGAGFKVFKFGFLQLHGPARKIWYDDVAVAPQRIGCP